MKKRLVLTVCSYLLMSGTALADPISIGSAVISGLMSVGAAGILPAISAGMLGSLVLGAGVIGAQMLVGAMFGPKVPKIDPGEYKSTFETGNSSEIRAIGRVRIAGLKAFGNTAGYNRWRLICHVRGPVAAIEEHFIGGREVTIDSDGAVSSPPWARKGGSWLYIKSKRGDGTETAWTELRNAFPALWSTEHRVRGIAQTLIQYISPGIEDDKFLKLYQGGEPLYERVQRSEYIFDPRDASQHVDHPNTWKYSDNGVLGVAHILRSYPSLKSSDIDWDVIAQEATKADQVVNVHGGTEPRARAWGIWPSEQPRGEVVEQALQSIGAEIVPTENNKYAIRLIDDIRMPELTITAKDIVDLQWKSGPDSVERPNVCRIKYYSPERNYEMTEIALSKNPDDPTSVPLAWSRDQIEIDRVGEQYFDVELPFCPSCAQAQRIGRRLFSLARADVGMVTTNMAGLAAWGHTTINLELPDLDEVVTAAIGTPRVNDGDGTVEIPFIIWPDIPVWSVGQDEAPPPERIPDMQYESELPTPELPTGLTQVKYPDGSYELRASFTDVAGGTNVESVGRTYTDGEPDPWQQMTTYSSDAGSSYAYRSGDHSGKKVDLRVRFFNDEDDGSYWSPILSIDPVIIDNSMPEPPKIFIGTHDGGSTDGNYIISVTSNELKTCACRVEIGGTLAGQGKTRPHQPYTNTVWLSGGSHGATFEIRAYAITSDGTKSLAAIRTIEVSGDGGNN